MKKGRKKWLALVLTVLCLALSAPAEASTAKKAAAATTTATVAMKDTIAKKTTTGKRIYMTKYVNYSKKGYTVFAWNNNSSARVTVYKQSNTKGGSYSSIEYGGTLVVNMSKAKSMLKEDNTKYLCWIPVYLNNLKDSKGNVVTGYVPAKNISLTVLNLQKLSDNSTINTALRYGFQYIGTPFLLGGSSLTSGIDCSNFVCTIYRAAGKSMPSWAHTDTLQSVSRQISKSELKAGDLIFYYKYDTYGPIDHVGVYLGNGLMLNSSGHYGSTYPQGGICIKRLDYGARTPVRYMRLYGF